MHSGLEPGEGTVIEISHTGRGNVEITGSMRGMPQGIVDHGWLDTFDWKSPMSLSLYLSIMAAISLITMITALIFLLNKQAVLIASVAIINAPVLFALSSLFLIPILQLRWIEWKKKGTEPPRTLIQQKEE
jgi:hypothetical protein